MSIAKFLDPKNDFAFRRIFGTEKNKDILIHFINDILNLQGADQVQEVTLLPTIQDPEIIRKKQSVVDVLCTDAKGIQFIIEMEVSPQKGFEKRAQYYAAKAYSRQLGQGNEEGARYIDLKEVIFIAICNRTIFKDKTSYISHHITLDKQTYAHDLKDFSFTFIELPKFKIKQISQLTNIVEKWCYFFKYAPTTQELDLPLLAGKDTIIKRAYEELNQFNWTEAELLIYEEARKRIMDNLAAEEYLLDQGRAEGMEKGRIEGIEEGKIEGKIEGKAEERIEIARNMIKKGYDTSAIEELTGISKENIELIKQELE